MVRRFDPLAIGYAVVGLAALTLTSVATFTFFDYLLPWELALAATIVLASGLPLLKFAARIDPVRGRAYGHWLYAVLGVELVAQYFKAQASFAPTVLSTAALARTDLATAATNGVASRVLAFVFLASLPFVVLAMCQALADRVASQHARSSARKLAKIRARVRRLRAALAPLRAQIATLHALLAERDAQLAAAARLVTDLRTELARERSRPVLDVETAMRVLVDAGAPEATLRGWRQSGRLTLIESREE